MAEECGMEGCVDGLISNVALGNFFHETFRLTNSLSGPGITLYCSVVCASSGVRCGM